MVRHQFFLLCLVFSVPWTQNLNPDLLASKSFLALHLAPCFLDIYRQTNVRWALPESPKELAKDTESWVLTLGNLLLWPQVDLETVYLTISCVGDQLGVEWV